MKHIQLTLNWKEVTKGEFVSIFAAGYPEIIYDSDFWEAQGNTIVIRSDWGVRLLDATNPTISIMQNAFNTEHVEIITDFEPETIASFGAATIGSLVFRNDWLQISPMPGKKFNTLAAFNRILELQNNHEGQP